MSFRSWNKIAGIAAVFAMFAEFSQAEDRTFDGLGNNLSHPQRGSAGTAFRRLAPAAYDDSFSAPAVADRPNARAVSNALCSSSGNEGTNSYRLSDYVWQWGQFLDHDMTLAVTASAPEEAFFIEVDTGDPLEGVIPLMRTIFDPATGETTPREQVNNITSFIDASMVYGSDSTRAAALRTFSGGRLKTSSGELLPMNTSALPNANDLDLPEDELFLGGDVRSNEQLGLTCMHTVFMREHNRLAGLLAAQNADWDDERLYQRARKIVGALVQAVTYHEFLPALLGSRAPDPTSFTYDPDRDPSATNEFATALYRVGHTMVSDQMMLMQDDGQPAAVPSISVLDAFFTPSTLIAEPGKVDWILMGLAMQGQMDVDTKLVDNLRNQLFGPAGAGGLDLAAINIQRGRDHGLASYNDTRAAYGLSRKQAFADITADSKTQAALASVYSDVDELDLWIGGLAEDHLPGAAVGELVAEAMLRQFTDTAEGDRLFYLFDPELAEMTDGLNSTSLGDIIMRNTGLSKLQLNVFYLRDPPLSKNAVVSISMVGSDVVIALADAEPEAAYALQRSADGSVWEELKTASTTLAGGLTIIDTDAVGRLDRALYRFQLQE